ncbi:hypothetical protein DK293_11260, partial [Vibrio cholerae]|nr:hypothetical protein [Vibrio cholerae]
LPKNTAEIVVIRPTHNQRVDYSSKKRPFLVAQLCCSNIPFLLEAAAVLATFAPHSHNVSMLMGITHLPPTCNAK